MLYRWWLRLKDPENTLWLHPTLGAIFAVAIAALGVGIKSYLPTDALPNIEASTVEGLLDILASSMLAVTTFSLSIMVSAFSSAANSATPRASKLVMADDNTRVAIASFISAFIYSIVAKTAMGVGYYDQNGLFVLFIATALMTTYLVYTLIRWVHTLSLLGRMSNTIHKINTAAETSLNFYRFDSTYGASAERPSGPPDDTLCGHGIGYLTHINLNSVQSLATDLNIHIHICIRAGKILYGGEEYAHIYGGTLTNEQRQALRDKFILQPTRSYDQDPRYGLIVLSEVGQRALSPAVNDPGTAIQVLSSLAILLIRKENGDKTAKIYDRLSIVALPESDFVSQPFAPIARDGAGNIEIGINLQKTLSGIYRLAPESAVRGAAKIQAEHALKLAKKGLVLPEHFEKLEVLHNELFEKRV